MQKSMILDSSVLLDLPMENLTSYWKLSSILKLQKLFFKKRNLKVTLVVSG